MVANEVAKNWILLNNEIMIKHDDEFSLHKDKEAVRAYFLEYVNKNTVFFYTLKEKIDYLIENNYYIDFYQWFFLLVRYGARHCYRVTLPYPKQY